MTKMKEILIPIAVVAVGVLGAFASQMPGSSSDAMLVLEPAWIDNEIPCKTNPYMCAPEGSEICTVTIAGVDHVLRGKKIDEFATCSKVLFKP